MTPTTWIVHPIPSEETVKKLATLLSTQHSFPISIASILVRRNITSLEASKSYFVPDIKGLHDPYLMKNMDEAVNRILAAKKNREKILLFGDYDVDGATAVTLLSLFLEEWGFDFTYYIPDRYREGYGISFQGIDYAREIGASLIISLDCGIKAIDKVKYAGLHDIDVIICDHHTPGTTLPEAKAILDPRQDGCDYPYKDLTGCGVGFKLIQALTRKLTASGVKPPEPDYDPFDKYADLITLSIACDIVPITGENRIIAYHGLEKLRSRPLPGIKALQEQAIQERKWDISDLVFFIGPRVNSAGRLGHARDAVEVLLGKDESLQTLAAELQKSNNARKTLDKETTYEALEMITHDPEYASKSTTVLYNPKWHKGVIGIVASRLIERYYRPTVILTQSEGKLVGSARSVKGFDLYAALDSCHDHMLQFGGHKYAAGLSLKEEHLSVFSRAFDRVVTETITEDQKSRVLYIDYLLGFSQINSRFIRLISRMAPFVPENPKPVFMAQGVKVLHVKVLKEVHVKFVLEHENTMLEAIGFNLAEKWNMINETLIDIAFQPMFNQWNNKVTINLRLKDIRQTHV